MILPLKTTLVISQVLFGLNLKTYIQICLRYKSVIIVTQGCHILFNGIYTSYLSLSEYKYVIV